MSEEDDMLLNSEFFITVFYSFTHYRIHLGKF
jgi:hypothetical protein